jgi:integrase
VIVGAALAAAVEHGLLVRNPAKLAKPPKASAVAEGEETMRTWTAQELGQFLAGERAERLYPLWVLIATTGMRRGEALGLGWNHVDLDSAQVVVRRTLVDVVDADDDRPVWSDPKTAKGRRTIALDSGTVAALRGHRAAQARERLMVGTGYAKHNFVFAMPDGRPLHPERLSRTFQARSKRAAVPVIRLHDLRHTWATLALEAGVNPRVVQERLGHASVAITLRVYTHVRPHMQADAAERVAALTHTPHSPRCCFERRKCRLLR